MLAMSMATDRTRIQLSAQPPARRPRARRAGGVDRVEPSSEAEGDPPRFRLAAADGDLELDLERRRGLLR